MNFKDIFYLHVKSNQFSQKRLSQRFPYCRNFPFLTILKVDPMPVLMLKNLQFVLF